MGSRIENQRGFPARGSHSRGRRNQRNGGRPYGNDNRRPNGNYRDRSYGNSYQRNRSNGYAEQSNWRESNRGRLDQRSERVTERRQPDSYADRARTYHQPPTAETKEPNMHQLLQQISNTLVSLVGRVDSLEKTKGSDSKIAAAPRATRPAVPAGPLLQKSTNDDFISVSKALYKMVQIGHHESNWERLPKSLGDRLAKLIDDINPPMGDCEFKKKLQILTQQYGEEVRRLVCDHLGKKRVELERAAASLNPTDVDRAKEVASKYLNARLGKRLTVQRRSELMNSAASMVGAQRKPLPSPKTAQGKPRDEWTTVTNRTPPKGAQVGVAGKRKAESIHSTPTENRYSPLANEATSLGDSDMEPEPTPQASLPPKPKRTPKKARRCDMDVVITEHNVHIHAGLKNDWQVKPESSDICVLVVGDSNLKKVRLIPQYWQVNALPGGDLCDLTNGLDSLTGKNKQYTIVLQAGMNHRDNHDADDEADIRTMLFTARRNQSINEIFFNGVSIPAGMPEANAQRLDALNRFMEAEVGQDFYIAPLDRADVRIEPNDRWQIHYDQVTVDRISQNMIRQITGSDFQSNRA